MGVLEKTRRKEGECSSLIKEKKKKEKKKLERKKREKKEGIETKEPSRNEKRNPQ